MDTIMEEAHDDEATMASEKIMNYNFLTHKYEKKNNEYDFTKDCPNAASLEVGYFHLSSDDEDDFNEAEYEDMDFDDEECEGISQFFDEDASCAV